MNLKALFIIGLLFSFNFLMPLSIDAQSEIEKGVITGDKVYIDDDKAYLSAEPHTLGSSGYVTFNLISKQFTGDIDIALGFARDDIGVKRPQIWRNYSHTLFKIELQEVFKYQYFYNVSAYYPQVWNDSVTPDFCNRNNNYLYLVEGFDFEPYSYLVAFDSYKIQGNDIRVTCFMDEYVKVPYESWFYDWSKLNISGAIVNYDFEGKSVWTIASRYLNVNQNRNYTFRIWVDIPFSGLQRSEGEYFFAVKPSSQTISQAVEAGTFYVLDPWWNTSWYNRVRIYFNNSYTGAEILLNFTLFVNVTASVVNMNNIRSDCADLRFISSNNVTVLNHENELSSASVCDEWVRHPQINVSNTEYMYIYYGNSGASSDADPENTWDPSYKMVQHLQETTNNTSVDSTINSNDGVAYPLATPPTSTNGGQIGNAIIFDGTEDFISIPASQTLNVTVITIEAWVKRNGSQISGFGGYWDDCNIGELCGRSRYLVQTDGGLLGQAAVGPNTPTIVAAAGSVANNTYTNVVVTYNTTHIGFWVNGAEQVPVATNGAYNYSSDPKWIGKGFLNTYYFNGTIDEIRISNTARTSSRINATYLSETDSFLFWGVLESLRVIGQLPSVEDLVGNDTTVSSTYEDVDGLAANLTMDEQADVLIMASIQGECNVSAVASWRLVFAGVNYQGLSRQVGTLSGNIVLVDLVKNKSAGTHLLKLQHNVSAGILSTINTTIYAVQLHNGNGKVPANSSFTNSDTITGVTPTDISGLSTNITLQRTSHVWMALTFSGEYSLSPRHGNFTIEVNNQNLETRYRNWPSSNQWGALSLITRTNEKLPNGTYTVKGIWQGDSTGTLTGMNFSLVVIAGECDGTVAEFEIQKVLNVDDTTTATNFENIDNLSLNFTTPDNSHVMGFLTLDTEVSNINTDVFHSININGTDQEEMKRGHSSPAQSLGSIGQVARTNSTLLAGIGNMTGRWHTDPATTASAMNLILVSIVLFTEDTGIVELTVICHQGIDQILVNGIAKINLTAIKFSIHDVANITATLTSDFNFFRHEVLTFGNHTHFSEYNQTMNQDVTVESFALSIDAGGGTAGVSMLLLAVVGGFAVMIIIVALRKK